MQFTPEELRILSIVQGNLPDSLHPYADVAAQCNVTEQKVLSLLKRLKEDGAIRRFGATLRHQRAGWKHNAMVAWIASESDAVEYGPIAARHPRISHAYFRPSSAPDWPYTLYTMTHGRSEDECLQVVDDLKKQWPLKDYAILHSIRELKKTSMRYFR